MPNYHKSEKKELAREDTIINMYRKLLGRKSLPKNKEYWTLCADCTQGNNEFSQVIKYRLIEPNQFCGVDSSQKIIKGNKKEHPESKWFAGDLYNVLGENVDFNPGIVNYDSMVMPMLALPYFTNILNLLNRRNIRNVLAICNMAISIRSGSKRTSWEEVHDMLTGNAEFSRIIQEGTWKIHDHIYEYEGSNKRQTIMGTFFVYRR